MTASPPRPQPQAQQCARLRPRWCGWSIGHRIATTSPRSVGSPSRSCVLAC